MGKTLHIKINPKFISPEACKSFAAMAIFAWKSSFPFDVFSLFPKNSAMKSLLPAVLLIFLLNFNTVRAEVHVWEKVELTFHSQNHYNNPYTNVEVWVDLQGPS